MDIIFRNGESDKRLGWYDSKTETLVPGSSDLTVLGSSPKGIVVRGLSPDTEYKVAVYAYNAFGWGPHSPHTSFKTLSDDGGDVVITKTSTQEERDAEARKRAIDLTQPETPGPPPVKRKPNAPTEEKKK